jgi:hypothetical protein
VEEEAKRWRRSEEGLAPQKEEDAAKKTADLTKLKPAGSVELRIGAEVTVAVYFRDCFTDNAKSQYSSRYLTKALPAMIFRWRSIQTVLPCQSLNLPVSPRD